MDGWNASFLLGWPIFRCCVSFRECIFYISIMEYPKDFHHCSVIYLIGVLLRCRLKHVDVVGRSACNVMFSVNLS